MRKGIRNLEGLLAKMCLAPALNKGESGPPRKPEDPVFREFIRLQSGFEWNVTIRLISCLERLLGKKSNTQTNNLILSSLELLQGMLLLHPPSRHLFAREIHMNVLLDLLDAGNSGSVQCATLLTLVTALIDKPQNTRTFEALEGLPTVTSLFKRRDTPRDVKLKCLEFLYFYLMPETSTTPSKPSTPSREGRRRGSSNSTSGSSFARPQHIKTTAEKQQLLGEWLTNVDDLVADLREGTPFAV